MYSLMLSWLSYYVVTGVAMGNTNDNSTVKSNYSNLNASMRYVPFLAL